MRKEGFSLKTEYIVAVIFFIGAALMSLFSTGYRLNLFTTFFNSVILCFSISLIWGYCGTFSFGQAAFYTIGGYVYAFITLNVGSPAITPLALLCAVVFTGLFALILGYFMFYGGVNDMFVAIMTICITLSLSLFMAQTGGNNWKIGSVPMGGLNGINRIPPLTIGTLEFKGINLYYLSLTVLVVCMAVFVWLKHSRTGYMLFAVREDRERSRMLGYNVPLIQMVIFGIGGALAALAGVLYVSWGGYIGPTNMSLTASTIPVVLVAAGGKKSPTAAMVFAIIYYYAYHNLAANASEYALIILGVALVLVMLFIPEGVFSTLFSFFDEKLEKILPAKNCPPVSDKGGKGV